MEMPELVAKIRKVADEVYRAPKMSLYDVLNVWEHVDTVITQDNIVHSQVTALVSQIETLTMQMTEMQSTITLLTSRVVALESASAPADPPRV